MESLTVNRRKAQQWSSLPNRAVYIWWTNLNNYATHFISDIYCSLHKVYLSTVYKFTFIDTSNSGFLSKYLKSLAPLSICFWSHCMYIINKEVVGYMLPDACSIEGPRALASACQIPYIHNTNLGDHAWAHAPKNLLFYASFAKITNYLKKRK